MKLTLSSSSNSLLLFPKRDLTKGLFLLCLDFNGDVLRAVSQEFTFSFFDDPRNALLGLGDATKCFILCAIGDLKGVTELCDACVLFCVY
jgi:hypothetical protein